MIKSPNRVLIEKKIKRYYKEAYNIGNQMIDDEFNGDKDKALSDKDFVVRMQMEVVSQWDNYLHWYRKLEDLDKEENYAAMKFYAKSLDLIATHLPDECKNRCYYPFAGVDFYWSKIFKTLVCEDIAYNKMNSINAWWGWDWYNREKRSEIISLLKKLGIVPSDHQIKCILGIAERASKENDLNDVNTTLLIKGGHDILDYVNTRFKKELLFGSIITVSSVNALNDMDKELSNLEYSRIFSNDKIHIVVPYAMELNDIHIYVKRDFL